MWQERPSQAPLSTSLSNLNTCSCPSMSVWPKTQKVCDLAHLRHLEGPPSPHLATSTSLLCPCPHQSPIILNSSKNGTKAPSSLFPHSLVALTPPPSRAPQVPSNARGRPWVTNLARLPLPLSLEWRALQSKGSHWHPQPLTGCGTKQARTQNTSEWMTERWGFLSQIHYSQHFSRFSLLSF